MNNHQPRQTNRLQTWSTNTLWVMVIIIGLISAFFLFFARDYVRYPVEIGGPLTLTSPAGVTLHIERHWQVDSYDLLWVTITNDSETPFETAGFRFNYVPLPDPPETIRPWVEAPTLLPEVIPPGVTASGTLHLPHPPPEQEGNIPLYHRHGPLLVTFSRR